MRGQAEGQAAAQPAWAVPTWPSPARRALVGL